MGQSNQSLLSDDIRELREPLQVIWGDQVKQSCMITPEKISSISNSKMSQLTIINVECH